MKALEDELGDIGLEYRLRWRNKKKLIFFLPKYIRPHMDHKSWPLTIQTNKYSNTISCFLKAWPLTSNPWEYPVFGLDIVIHSGLGLNTFGSLLHDAKHQRKYNRCIYTHANTSKVTTINWPTPTHWDKLWKSQGGSFAVDIKGRV